MDHCSGEGYGLGAPRACCGGCGSPQVVPHAYCVVESAGVVEVLDAKPDEGEAEGEAEAEAEEEAEQLDPNMDFGMHAPRLGIHKWGEPNIA